MTWTRHENGTGATPTFGRRRRRGGGGAQLYTVLTLMHNFHDVIPPTVELYLKWYENIAYTSCYKDTHVEVDKQLLAKRDPVDTIDRDINTVTTGK